MSPIIMIELIIAVLIINFTVWIYIGRYADTVARFIGYELAIFAMPLLIGILIGIVIRQIMNRWTKISIKPWQYFSIIGISALILPVWFIVTMS